MSVQVKHKTPGIEAMVSITAHVPEDAMSAGLLGTERIGHGVRIREDGIALEPQLPEGWTQMGCCVQWRGCRLRLIFAAVPTRIEVAVEGSGELTIAVIDGPACRARAGRHYAARRQGSAWGAWREVGR